MMRLLSSDHTRSRFVLLVSVLLLAAQLAIVQHSFSGKAHRAGELCQICMQFEGSGHALPPAAQPSPVLAIGLVSAIAGVVAAIFARRTRPAQPRAPPLS
jgi:hypothetical protein